MIDMCVCVCYMRLCDATPISLDRWSHICYCFLLESVCVLWVCVCVSFSLVCGFVASFLVIYKLKYRYN